jgi:hypothetical protein
VRLEVPELQRPGVVANDPTVVVDDGHAGGNRVEGDGPLAAGFRQLLVQTRVHDRHGDVIREAQKHLCVVLIEIRGPVEHAKRADHATRGRQWHDNRLANANESLRLKTHVGIVRHVVRDHRRVGHHGPPADARLHGQHEAREEIAAASRRDDVQVVFPTKRDARAFGAEQRHRMTHDETHYLAHAQRFAHGPRYIGQRFRLTSLALTLRVEARVAQRARRLRTHREQEIGIVVAERITANARHRKHRHEMPPDAQRNGEQRAHRCPRRDDECIGADELRRVRMRLRDEHRLTRARDACNDSIAERCLGQRQLDATDHPHEWRHGRSLEIRMHHDDAVANDQLRYTARDLERDLSLVERTRHRVAHDLKPLQPLRLTSSELRQAHPLDVVDHLLSEQLDRAQSRQRGLPFIGRIAEDECGHEVAGRRCERQHMCPADSPLGSAVAKVAQGEHLVRLHTHRDASRTLVVAFANRDPNAAVADRVDGVHEDAKPLIERRRALDVDQRRMQREIVISITKERANPAAERRRQGFEQRKLIGRPPLISGDRCGFDGHAALLSVGAVCARCRSHHCRRGTRTCAANGSTTISNGVIPTRSPSACTGLGGSVSIRRLRPAV